MNRGRSGQYKPVGRRAGAKSKVTCDPFCTLVELEFMRILFLVVFICLFSADSVAGDLVTSFREAVVLGDAQEKGHQTRRYFEHDLLPYYEQKYGPVFQSCFASTDHPDTTSFSFVAAIGIDGRVMRLYNDRDTNIFACARRALQREEFPHPPVSPYYLHIEMQFAQ